MIDVHPKPDDRPQPELQPHYDVVVIGGGPAGSTAGALLAEHGRRVLVLDRSPFPRFHIGESLIPETYWTLDRLGLIPQLRKTAFPKKYSVQFVSDSGKESAPFYFDQHDPHESSQTWQVVRGEFDKLLLDNAIEKGATAHTQAHVLDVLFEGERAVGVRVRLGESSPENDSAAVRDISCSVLIDATGQTAFLANRLGLKQPDGLLRKATIWTYFRGALRDAGKDEGATLILQTQEKRSWFWYIPLPDDIVSVGCTGSLDHMFGKDRGTAADVFNRELERCPQLERRLASATRHADFMTTKDFSYRATRAAGPGWVLVGDAFGFIDPVYSTGVFLALKSGELAADNIHEALRENDLSTEKLSSWHPVFRDGIELFRKLVYAFYTPDFSFGQFLRHHPQYRDNLIDMLIGAVFKPGVGEMFDAMPGVVPPSDWSESQRPAQSAR